MNDSLHDHELDRLRERHRSNPKSRIFAPLADRYRKLGQLDDALRVCQEGLAEHPEYSSAHVILAKIHLDREERPQAEAAFDRVLELDPANLLALRSLGQLAEEAGRPEVASEYWSRLLEVDPMHEEALARLEAASEASEEFVGESTDPPVATHPMDEDESVESAEFVAEPDHDDEPADAERADASVAEGETEEKLPTDPVEAERVRSGGIATATLADIYYSQGFKAKALSIYERMLRAEMDLPGLAEKVRRIRGEMAELESHLPTEAPPLETPARPALDEVLSARFVDEPAAVEETDPAPDDASEQDFTNFKTWLERNKV